MIIRIPVRGIKVQGRATMGVRVMKLKPGDRVVSLARLVQE
jgi:DNA gyrase subunit A